MNEMRIPVASKVKEANTPAERLRAQLKRLEAMLGKLGSSSDATDALEILTRFDQVNNLVTQLEKSGMDLAPEKTRIETITEQTKRKAGLLVKTLGGTEELHALRKDHSPDPEHWWWFLDKYLKDQQHQKRRRVLRTLGIAVVVLAILGLLYNLFLAPDPETRARYELEQEAERALLDGDVGTALTKVNEALNYGQKTADLLILKGVILEESDTPEQAEGAFAEARKLMEDVETFYLMRAQIYLRTGKSEPALADAQSVLEANPDSAYGYYFKGTALTALNRLAEAEESLEKASELASEQDNPQLQGMARVQIANLSMMINAPSTQTVTPENE
jgi:tetratricopeptide (TPR) repeat protein